MEQTSKQSFVWMCPTYPQIWVGRYEKARTEWLLSHFVHLFSLGSLMKMRTRHTKCKNTAFIFWGCFNNTYLMQVGAHTHIPSSHL